MAVVTFSKPVSFAIAPMRDLLTQHLPLYKWQCGENDSGGEHDIGSFVVGPLMVGPLMVGPLVVGRSATTAIFVELKASAAPCETPAPPHEWRLLIGEPTTEQKPIADSVTLIICMAAMALDEDQARCQVVADGTWLTAHDVMRVFKAVLAGESLDIARGLGQPAACFGSASAVPVQAMLEVADVRPAIESNLDLPALSRPAVPPMRRAGGFGRKGL